MLFSRLNAAKTVGVSRFLECLLFLIIGYFIPPLSWVMRVCITGQVYVNVFEQDLIVFY